MAVVCDKEPLDLEIYAKIAFMCSGRIDDKSACNLTYMVVYTNFSPTVNTRCANLMIYSIHVHPNCSGYYLLYFISLCIHDLPHKN